MASALKAGTKAPPFSLRSTPDQMLSLSDFKDTAVVLVFYPADWSPVCSDELAVFNELIPYFREKNAAIVGVSVDGPWCHTAFAKDRKFHFPLISDFEPKGEVARKYGVYRESDGISERAIFLIDGEGMIRWSYVSPLGVNPGVDGVLDALESMQPAKGERHEQA